MVLVDTVERDIQQARGGGQTLADNIRGPMEQAFGADFSGVRIHTGSHSDQLNHAVQAKAFTTGQDVFFRQGEYELGSRGGQELLAHELTHVVQQNAGAVMRTLSPHQQYPQHPVTKIPLVNTENHMIQGIHEAATNSQASDGVSSVLNNTANSATDALYAIQRTIGQMSPNANKGLIQATTAAGPVKSRVATGQSIIQRIETINILGHSKEATDDVPLPIGRHLKEEAEGQHILRRLAQGDETALRELGVKFPSDYELQSHEWGLGYDKDEEMYVIVRGGPGMVNWPLLENVDGIAHTHPQPKDHPKLIDYSQDSMPELKVIDAFEQTSLVGIDGVFTGTYNSVLPSNSDLNASYTTYTTKPEMLYTPFRINDGGFFSTEPKDPLVSVEYGPVVATLRAGELGKNDEANMIMHFYGPIKVFRGTEEFWSGVIKCDTGRMAWLQKEKIPEDAKFRRENQLLLERRKGPELFEVEEKIKQREPSLVPSTPLLEKETVSAPMDIHSQLFPKEYYKAVKENARKKGAKFSGGLSVSKYGKLVKECNGYMEKGMWKKAAIEIDKIVTGLKDLDGKGLEYWESPAKKIEFFDPLYKKAIAVQQYIYSKT